MTLPDLEKVFAIGDGVKTREAYGRITDMIGISLQAVGIEAALGDQVMIQSRRGEVPAEVIGFGKSQVVLMPMSDPRGIAPGDAVYSLQRPISIRLNDGCLGRILDGLGNPLDGGPALCGAEHSILVDAPKPMDRESIVQPMETGISCIDGFLTLGRGQRIGIFAGSGVGKSTLLGMIAKGSDADVNVIALVGERGREVKDFVEDVLGPESMKKSVLVVATSDVSPLMRFKATATAITISEYFRDQGKHVLFMIDSVTRFANAAREIGLAAGEPPTLRGYPPSFFTLLPKFVERLGNCNGGSITGLFTVLVEGDDFNEPVSDTMRGILDGHIILDRKVASRGLFPAINVLQSISRLMNRVVSPDQVELARVIGKMMAIFEENRDFIQVGAYQKGGDPELDRAIAIMPKLEKILHHGSETRAMAETTSLMQGLVNSC